MTPPIVDAMAETAVLQVRQLSKHYGSVQAVQELTFDVYRGEIFGLIGPDGAGKTTTFHLLGGVLSASSGEADILGRTPQQARPDVGYLTQQFSLYLDLSIDENLRYNASLRQVAIADLQARKAKYLGLMGLDQIGDRLASQLSGGMKQKLALCCALVAQPQILLLDEPTTGVDPVSRREFWDILAELAADEGLSILVATPYLDEAERCHRLALMSGGQIQELGTLAELRAHLGWQRLQVWTPHLAASEALLRQAISQGGIADVQRFGDRLDVLVADAQRDAPQVQQLLQEQGLSPDQIEATAVTLENVFVARLRQQGSDPPFLPLPRRDRPRGATLATKASDVVAIGAQALSKAFGPFQAVKQVNLAIHYGEIYGLLGANGAGKTTLIKLLCGLLESTSGEMTLAGQGHNLRRGALRGRIGYMSQKFTLYDDLTVLENLEFYCGVYQVPRSQRAHKIGWVLETCGLLGQEQLITRRLPGGWKQRVAFGASVMHEPEILFLDEPTSGVDPLARRQFWRLINHVAQQGTAVLVTTHYLEEAEQCHRMGFMVAGEMVLQGSPQAIKAAQPGQLLELQVDRPQAAATCLRQQLARWRVAIFGDRLHVILDDPAQDLPPLEQLLKDHQIALHTWRRVPFSLEDAFISVVQRTNTGTTHLAT
jgi:ABC-2 type transport system ATP-binding protein